MHVQSGAKSSCSDVLKRCYLKGQAKTVETIDKLDLLPMWLLCFKKQIVPTNVLTILFPVGSERPEEKEELKGMIARR
jgi:hypothetical protein